MINTLENTPFSDEDVLELVQNAFAPWKVAGLDTALLRMNLEEWRHRILGRTVLVYLEGNKLLGTLTFSISNGGKGGYISYVAVRQDTKRSGIATMLREEAERRMKAAGVEFIESDTAVRARWSVKWHRRNGFKIVGLASFSTNNYNSFLFRKSLCGKESLVGCALRFVKSAGKLFLKIR